MFGVRDERVVVFRCAVISSVVHLDDTRNFFLEQTPMTLRWSSGAGENYYGEL